MFILYKIIERAVSNLKGSQVRIDGHNVDNLEIAGDHAGPEHALGQQVRVVRHPILSGIFTDKFIKCCVLLNALLYSNCHYLGFYIAHFF